MIYQLSSGKIVEIDLHTYLDMDDNDFRELNSLDIGSSADTPWLQSAIRTKKQVFRDLADYVDDEVELNSDIIIEDDFDDSIEIDLPEDTGE